MLLDSGRVTMIAGFVNHQGIFSDVHRSYKFACNVFQKGGKTESIRLVFMRETLEDLAAFDAQAFALDAEVIRSNPSETYAIPEVANLAQWTAQRALSVPPRLVDPALGCEYSYFRIPCCLKGIYSFRNNAVIIR